MKSICENDGIFEYIAKIEDLFSVELRERVLQEFIISPFLQTIFCDLYVVPVDIKVSGKAHKYELYCGHYGYLDNKKRIHKIIETPDICIARKWEWLNEKSNSNNYISTVEIKTPFSDNEYWVAPGYIDNIVVFENKVEDMVNFINENMLTKSNGEYIYKKDSNYNNSLKKQVGIHLRGINKVIVTDGIRWIFFYKIDDICSALKPIDLGKRLCKHPRKYYKHVGVEWDIAYEATSEEQLQINNKFEILKDIIKKFIESDIDKVSDLNKIII